MSETPLSKNAQKKLAKAERFAANKLERRAREKEARKEKKRQKRAAAELDGDHNNINDDDDERIAKKPRIAPEFNGRVVIDLGFDDKMNDKEIISLTSQLAYTYSANRHAMYPFSLVFSSLNARTFSRLESLNDAGYKRWSHTLWWHEDYTRLWSPNDNDTVTHAHQNTVVYLTADADEELMELKQDETYIIGGICDHNRYKNLCLNKANESGIRSARLPIGRYLAHLPTRKVLTVNQVMEILIRWVETKDWEEALHAVVPKRKFRMNANNDNDNNKDDAASGGAGEVDQEKADVGEVTEIPGVDSTSQTASTIETAPPSKDAELALDA